MMQRGARRFVGGRLAVCAGSTAPSLGRTVVVSVSSVPLATSVLPPRTKALPDKSIVQLQHLAPEGVDVYLKRATLSAMAAMTERVSKGLLACAERLGKIEPGQTLVHALPADAGVGLAEACCHRGYPFVAVVSVGSPSGWCESLRLLGARVLVTDEPEDVALRLQSTVAGSIPHGSRRSPTLPST